jgi:hypothetical protein
MNPRTPSPSARQIIEELLSRTQDGGAVFRDPTAQYEETLRV